MKKLMDYLQLDWIQVGFGSFMLCWLLGTAFVAIPMDIQREKEREKEREQQQGDDSTLLDKVNTYNIYRATGVVP